MQVLAMTFAANMQRTSLPRPISVWLRHPWTSKVDCFVNGTAVSADEHRGRYGCFSCVVLIIPGFVFGGLTEKYDMVVLFRGEGSNKDGGPLRTLRGKGRSISLVWEWLMYLCGSHSHTKILVRFVFPNFPAHHFHFIFTSSCSTSESYLPLPLCTQLFTLHKNFPPLYSSTLLRLHPPSFCESGTDTPGLG